MAVEQQITALNMQLAESNSQIGAMALALDTLRNESANAIQELRRLLLTAQTANAKPPKDLNFINAKVFEGGKFAGGPKESFKAWAKKVRIYFNAQHHGMRQALELSEDATSKVDIADLKLANWNFAAEANEKLHDFLMTFTAEEALLVVEPFGGDGFEAWRHLKLRFKPAGGATEIDRMMRMFNKKAVKNIAELPAAIDALDRELKRDEEMSGHKLPDHMKIALLVRLVAEKDERELKHPLVHNQKSFEQVRADILGVAVTERLEIQGRGVKEMDALEGSNDQEKQEQEAWTTKEWIEWTQAAEHEEELGYMGKGQRQRQERQARHRQQHSLDHAPERQGRQRRQERQEQRQRQGD